MRAAGASGKPEIMSRDFHLFGTADERHLLSTVADLKITDSKTNSKSATIYGGRSFKQRSELA
jgi:hypothetical protein